MHKMLLDAEKRKTREAVAALNATQAMSLPIQEEQMSDVSSDESSDGNDIMTQRVSELIKLSPSLELEYKLMTFPNSVHSSWLDGRLHTQWRVQALLLASTSSLRARLRRQRKWRRRVLSKPRHQWIMTS